MNIFAVSGCPEHCAVALDDKRLNKMFMPIRLTPNNARD